MTKLFPFLGGQAFAASLLLFIVAPSTSHASGPPAVGRARISDGAVSSAPRMIQPAGHLQHISAASATTTTTTGTVADCPTGDCNVGAYATAYGYPGRGYRGVFGGRWGWGRGACGFGGCPGMFWGYPDYNCCNGSGGWGCVGCTNYGFGGPRVAPVTTPVVRYGNQYQHYWPASWMGAPATGAAPVYPMVYQPTDTTQLGFYYKHVPHWHARPELLPPWPQPHWPIGAHHFGGGYVASGPVVDAEPVAVEASPAAATPAAPPPPQAAPEPPPEPTIVPEPEAYFNPNRAR